MLDKVSVPDLLLCCSVCLSDTGPVVRTCSPSSSGLCYGQPFSLREDLVHQKGSHQCSEAGAQVHFPLRVESLCSSSRHRSQHDFLVFRASLNSFVQVWEREPNPGYGEDEADSECLSCDAAVGIGCAAAKRCNCQQDGYSISEPPSEKGDLVGSPVESQCSVAASSSSFLRHPTKTTS